MKTQRVFLDNNVWNFLADGAAGRPAVEDLIDRYRQGEVQVVSSLEMQEEILGTARRFRAKYQRMRRVHNKLVGDRLLLPLQERYVAELRHGGALPEDARYNPRSRVRHLRHLLNRPVPIAQINDKVYLRKQESRERDLAARTATMRELEAKGLGSEFPTRVGRASVDEWARDIVREGAIRGLPGIPEEEVSLETVPSIWLLSAYTIATARRVITDNRKVQPSDGHDALHCAAGEYFDAMVTDDAEFQYRLKMIDDLPFSVLSRREFLGV